jgi:glycosyltransferase involved in cell wall biosynthesis
MVYVSVEYAPQYGGGIGTYVRAMAETLARHGHDITVLTVGDDTIPARDYENGVHIVRLPLTVSGTGPVGTLRTWQNRADSVAEALVRIARGGRIDVIEFCDYRGEGASYLAASDPGRRPVCVVRLHTPLSVLGKYNTGHVRQPVLEEFEHETLRAADHLVSPSRALADEIRDRVEGVPEIHISPHPVDPMFLELASTEGAARDEALYVGRFEERKGVETLGRAAEAFLSACPDARLVMIGGDTEKGPGQPSVRSLVEDAIPRRLRGRLELIDRIPREELIEHYRAARFCVFPSHFENFPNTCLEAMGLGRVVIGTDNSGMAEIIQDGVNGVITSAADADALAAAMTRTWSMAADQRAAMEAAAHDRIRTHYHPDIIAEHMVALYRGFVACKAPSVSAEPAASRTRRTPRDVCAASVAVVIPCYNHGRFLQETLASVRAQTHPVAQTIVVDDGSSEEETHGVLAQIERDGVCVIRQENAGLSAARNAGVRATDTDFFVPLDADDKLDPRFIERLLPPLLSDPGLGYSYGHVKFFDADGGGWDCPEYDPRKLLIENLSVATAVIRRRAFDEVGGYSRDMVYGFEDWDFWIALLSLGYRGRCTPEPLFHYRKHAGGSMLAETQKRRGEMVRQMIEHHRGLFAATLELSLAGKDTMFFQAHMDAWRMRAHMAGGAGGDAAASTVDDELYQRLLAQAELDHIRGSRFWRTMQRVKQAPPVGWINRWRYGADWDQLASGEDPRVRLSLIKNGRTYRLIRLFKRSPFYRWYARRKYGPDFDAPPV